VATRTEAGGTESRPPAAGERLEAFVLRLSLDANGEAQRCEVTHVRTMAEHAWAGWQPDELARFVQKHAKLRSAPARRKDGSPKQSPTPRRQDAPSPESVSSDHVVVLDAGKAIGGTSRDVNLVITNTQAAGGAFGYRATLAARGLGVGRNGEAWTALATRAGEGSAEDELALGFPGVQLPPGIQRLQLRLEVQLPAPAARPPALALA
jgi:hypothetical protein